MNIDTYRRIKTHILNAPTAIAGLALGISGVTWSWQNLIIDNTFVQQVGAIIGFALVFIISLKFILSPSILIGDLRHPITGSALPTFTMTLMVVSTTISYHSVHIAVVLWLFALCLHIVFLSFFIYYRFKNFNIEHLIPSWFVPPVGVAMAAVSFPGVESFRFIADYSLYFGIMCYCFILPIMLYRLLFVKAIAVETRPTLAILAAPSSLLLVAYLTMEKNPSIIFVSVLSCIALCMTNFIYFKLIKLIRLPFSPSFASYTFPLAISATGIFKLSALLKTLSPSIYYLSYGLKIFAIIELLIATVIISYVAYKFFRFFVAQAVQLNCAKSN